jgi:hypothetical protein
MQTNKILEVLSKSRNTFLSEADKNDSKANYNDDKIKNESDPKEKGTPDYTPKKTLPGKGFETVHQTDPAKMTIPAKGTPMAEALMTFSEFQRVRG